MQAGDDETVSPGGLAPEDARRDLPASEPDGTGSMSPEDALIHQATGALIARHGLSADAASARLHEEAAAAGISVVERAQVVVDSAARNVEE